MIACATTEGTQRYAARFTGRVDEGHFRKRENLQLSSIGIGTYLGEPDQPTDVAYTQAVIAAFERGANVIDTAINYRFMRSERSIGAALVELQKRGYAREEVLLCTKGGYLTPDGEMPVDPAAYFQWNYFKSGVLRKEDLAGGGHSMAPTFLQDQLDRSLHNLGVDCVDVYYLHNPETQLGDVPREEFLRRIRAAFEFLESAVSGGKIRFYGAATWNGLRCPLSAQDHLSLAELDATARDVAGIAHHFRFVQIPFNLAMTEALTRANQAVSDASGISAEMPLVRAAQHLGITLVANASLLQGQVARNLPPFVAAALGLENDTQRALQFARSAPGITTALVGMSHVEHVTANLKLAEIAPASGEQFARLFERREGA
jgi:aryl-alcohol dehydrogenase-like predicted oxidoreductase